MRPIYLSIAALLALSGCASTANLAGNAAEPAPNAMTTTAPAPAATIYLAELRAKKNRFLESQGYEANYEPLASDSDAGSLPGTAALAVSECGKIAHSRWAASVLYGQNFSGYENYVRTMERCLNDTAQG